MSKSNTVAVLATSSNKIQTADRISVGALSVKDSPSLQYAIHLESKGIQTADGSIFVWNGTHFQIEDRRLSEHQAAKWLAAHHPDKFSSFKVVDLVNSSLMLLPELEMQSKDVIPTLGGYIWLEKDANGNYSYQVKPHDRKCNLRYCINAALPSDTDWKKAKAGDSLFFKFLKTILPDSEVRGLVQEYIGYTFLGDTRFHTALVLVGDGANGKGTLTNIVSAAHQNVATANLMNLDGFGMQQLIGSSLILVDELPSRRFNEDAFKSLVTGNKIQVNRKNLPQVDFVNTAKFILSGNAIPPIQDKTDGVFRRLKIVRFDTSIPEDQRDGLLHEKIINSELGIVVQWAIEGLIRLLNRGHFENPKSVQASIRQARIESNSVLQYIEDSGTVVHTPDNFTHKDEIYGAYRDWCRTNGKNPLASDGFWKQVKNECKRLGIEVSDKQLRRNGKRLHCVDIAITAGPDEEVDTRVKHSYEEMMKKCMFVEVDGADNPFASDKVAD